MSVWAITCSDGLRLSAVRVAVAGGAVCHVDADFVAERAASLATGLIRWVVVEARSFDLQTEAVAFLASLRAWGLSPNTERVYAGKAEGGVSWGVGGAELRWRRLSEYRPGLGSRRPGRRHRRPGRRRPAARGLRRRPQSQLDGHVIGVAGWTAITLLAGRRGYARRRAGRELADISRLSADSCPADRSAPRPGVSLHAW